MAKTDLNFNFSGKKALVTGSGRGIGRDLVKSLSAAGAQTYALDIDAENLESLILEDPKIIPICVDLSDWEATRKSIDEIKQIDFLVNNAAYSSRPTPLLEVDQDTIDRCFEVNVKAIVNVSQAVAKHMIENGRPGSIVNISSVMSTRALKDAAVYCTTKGAVDQLTRTMALEFGPHQIRVNAVNPGLVITEFSKNRINDELKSRIPLGRYAETSDIVNPVLFLLSDGASMINGAFLHVDGGESIS